MPGSTACLSSWVNLAWVALAFCSKVCREAASWLYQPSLAMSAVPDLLLPAPHHISGEVKSPWLLESAAWQLKLQRKSKTAP